jgi:hypothetical protein
MSPHSRKPIIDRHPILEHGFDLLHAEEPFARLRPIVDCHVDERVGGCYVAVEGRTLPSAHSSAGWISFPLSPCAKTHNATSSFQTGSRGFPLPNPPVLVCATFVSPSSCCPPNLGVELPLPVPSLSLSLSFDFPPPPLVRRAASANARDMDPMPSEGPYEFVRGSVDGLLCTPPAAAAAEPAG